MHRENDSGSRRDFVTGVGRLASVMALGGYAMPEPAAAGGERAIPRWVMAEDWDLSWIDRLATATDRAIFDWPSVGNPSDPIVLEIAARYLDNCAAAYGSRRYEARAVLNIRTTAIPAALNDEAWHRHALGVEYKVSDPFTQQPAVRNPFWHRAPAPSPTVTLPSLEDLMQRGSIVLVCDFALGHLAARLAGKTGQSADEVHQDLRGSFVPGAFAVPSGIFGLARSQNAGCAFVRM